MRLECKYLSYTYPGSRKEVIKDLCFVMENPGFNSVFGPSGVGKTSLARLISTPGDRLGRQILTQQMPVILYSYNLERLPGWSATGQHLDKVTPEGKQDLKEDLIQIFDVREVLKSRFSTLSMGQQNRVNLIRYLLQDFDLLIMDESLANVDEKLRQTIILAMKEQFKDKMFLYISHNLMEVSTFCSQILVLGKTSKETKGFNLVSGQDLKHGENLDKTAVDQTMLEIMNAV